jgi:hypothetical protein
MCIYDIEYTKLTFNANIPVIRVAMKGWKRRLEILLGE